MNFILSISKLTLHVPQYGAWRADVVLEGGALPSGKVTLTVGDLVLKGTVARADTDAPDKPHAVVIGGAGWNLPIPSPLSYQSDSGVRLSTVLKDLARLAGETIEQPTDRTIGNWFSAPALGLLRDVLGTLASAGYVSPWRVDPDGVTRFGARAGITATARATVLRKDSAVGLTVIGCDAPKAFLPGNKLDDGTTIARLVITETPGHLGAEVWS